MTDATKLTIDTPELIDLEYELAGLGSRFMALFVDCLLQGVAILGVVIVLAMIGIVFNPFKESRTWALSVIVLMFFLMQWGYFAFFEIFWNGQTPGKRQARIRVINETGRRASTYEAVARNLLRAVDSLPGMYLLGSMVMFFSPQNKRLGDYVAGTVVVHDREPEETDIFFNTNREDIIEAINYAALSTNDLRLLENFLQRRLDIPIDARRRAAHKLASHFRQKCGVPIGSNTDDENLLEVLVRGFRRDARFYVR
jgi:uncharacterized RDD family membrane protein YckC